MFAQALANRRARGGVHLASALPLIGLLLIASLVVLFLVDKPEDVGLARFVLPDRSSHGMAHRPHARRARAAR